MIRIRAHSGLAFFQYRDHLVSDSLMMGFCDSWCYWTLTFSLEWRMLLRVVNIFLLVGIFNSQWYLWAYHYVIVQSLSHVRLCDPMECSTPGLPVLHHLAEFAQTHVHWISNVIQPSCLLLTPSPPAIFPSIRVFSNESALHIRWPKYWSFSNSPSNEYSRLSSFIIDWFDLLAVQGTLKNLLQHPWTVWNYGIYSLSKNTWFAASPNENKH